MFPTIHSWKGDDLTTQGFGALSDVMSCEVTEELNGAYTLELKYPLNALHSEYIEVGNIIMAKPNHNQTRQAFRINQIKKSLSNSITVYANHISYDMGGYYVRGNYTFTSLENIITTIDAWTWVDSPYYHQFHFQTDMSSSRSISMPVLQTLRSYMGGQDFSIINVYGGEWVYDNFNCFLTSRRGTDTGYRISYGKNLAEYDKEKDYNYYSHICAYWKKSDTVAVGNAVSTGIECPFRCGYIDVSKQYDNQPTTAQLDASASAYISTMNPAAQTIKITPAQIGNEVIGLGDSVLICYETVFQTRVIKTVWDVLTGTYKSLVLGTKKENIADTIKSLGSGSGSSSSGGGGGTPITVDSALSLSSENPVQNKVITLALNNKVDAEAGKGLSTNDFTTAEKNKLSGIETGAEVNVQADWSVASSTSDAYIKNKPTIPTKTSELTNDSGFVTSAVPPTRTVNGKALSSDITLDAGDIDATYGLEPTNVQDYLDELDSTKVDKVTGKGLSTNDFTTTLKNKLDGIASGAEVNVQADWNEADSTSDAYIKNKPNIPSGVIVDNALSTTSENAVQNKIITNALNDKVDKVTGKGLSTNDFTTALQTKLNGIETGAEVNVQADWDEADSTSDAYIKNKPASLNPADYVVEVVNNQTNGYTKWNSGKLESWQRQTITVNATTAWTSPIYYGSNSGIAYTSTFIDYPVVNITIQSTNGYVWLAPNYSDYTKTATGTLYFYSVGSHSNVAVTLNIHCVGKWK